MRSFQYQIDKLHRFVLRIRLDIDNLLVKAPVWKGKRVMTLKRALVHLLAVAYSSLKHNWLALLGATLCCLLAQAVSTECCNYGVEILLFKSLVNRGSNPFVICKFRRISASFQYLFVVIVT